MKPNIRIQQYQEVADTVSRGPIKWLTKYDLKIQFSDRDIAEAWKSKIEKMLMGEQPESKATGETT